MFSIFASVGNAAIPISERAGLLKFYNATSGDTWTTRTGWLDQPFSECTWFGVICDAVQSHVIGLSLNNNNLSGDIPDLGQLPELQFLNLSGNKISGQIPRLSDAHRLHLQILLLDHNELSGDLQSLDGFSQLDTVDVSFNALSGIIDGLNSPPYSPPLKQIALDHNMFTGGLQIAPNSTLKKFHADANQITGPLPDLVFPHLEEFTLSSNNLVGSIATNFGAQTGSLKTFDVSNNQLTLQLPTGYPVSLKYFNASNNALVGSMPSLLNLQLEAYRVDGNAGLSGQVGAVPIPNTLLAGESALCPSALVPSGNSQTNAAWDAATGHTPWNYLGQCASLPANTLPPAVHMTFDPTHVVVGGHPVMTITLTNPNAVTLTNVGFADSYPAGITNGPAPPKPLIANTCGGPGTVVAVGNGNSVSLTGGSIAPHGTCSISVRLTGAAAGTWTNSTGPVTSNEAPTNNNPSSATLRVVAINNPPVPQLDVVNVALYGIANTIVGDSRIPSSVLDNDVDPDQGDYVKTASLATSPACGTVNFNADGTFSYNSTTAQCVADSFTYSVCDSYGLCSEGNVHINISGGPPDAFPVSSPDYILVGRNGTTSVLSGGANSVLANDHDPDPGETETLTAELSAGPTEGTLSFNSDGTFTYHNTNPSAATDSFFYTACDIHHACSPIIEKVWITIQVPAPEVAMTFTPPSAPFGGASQMTITLTNADSSSAITGVQMGDDYPTGIANANGNPVASDSCNFDHDVPAGGTRANLINGTIPAGGTCEVVVNIVGAAVGIWDNFAGPVTSGNAQTNPGVGAEFTVEGDPAPSVTKSFSPSLVLVGGTSQMTIALVNSNANAIFGVQLDDIYPAGMANAAANPVLSDTCNFDQDVPAGGGWAKLANGTILANGHCEIVVNVVGTAPGSVENHTGPTTSINATPADDTSATLNVGGGQLLQPPTVAKNFNPPNVTPGGSSNMSITLTNPNGSAITGAQFIDTYPAGILNASNSPVIENTCGVASTLVADPNGTLASLGNGTIPANGSCHVVLEVIATANAENHTGAVPSANASTAVEAVATLLISGAGSNQMPVAVDDAIQLAANGTATLLVGGASSVLANDSDPDSNPLTAILAVPPTNGNLALNSDGTFSYHNLSGSSDSFQYKACDNGNPVLCATAVVTITIGNGPTNHLPFAVDDAIDVISGGTSQLLVSGASSVLANDVDPDVGDTLNATLLSNPSHGTVSFASDGEFSYVNANDGSDADSFVYQTCDNHGACATGVVSVTIGNGLTNHLPIVVDDAVQVVPNGIATILVGGATSVLANDTDPDPGETPRLRAFKFSELFKASGTLGLSPDGTFTYHNTDASIASDSFLYEACDLHGACTAAMVEITITNAAADHLPLAAGDAIQVAPGGVATSLVGGGVSVLSNDTDPDPGETATLDAKLISASAHGVVVLASDGTFNYQNDAADPATSDNFLYEACDVHGACVAATVTITIGASTNQQPVAVDDAIQVTANGMATQLVGGAASVLTNDLDPNGDPLTAGVTIGPVHGSLTLNANGTFSYHNTSGSSDSFQYEACDSGTPALCNTATVTITVGNGLNNHMPFAVDDAIEVTSLGTATTTVGSSTNPASVLANDIDPDVADTLTASLLSGPSHGSLTIAGDGTFSYTNTSAATSDIFMYQACDNHGSCDMGIVTVTIGSGLNNHLPIIVDDAIQVLPNDSANTLIGDLKVPNSVLDNDIDPDAGDLLSARKISGLLRDSGVVAVAPDGTFVYQNTNPSATSDSFLYEACDDYGACTGGLVSVSITNGALDHVPSTTGDAIEVAPNGTATTLVGDPHVPNSVLDNDSDPDTGDLLRAYLIGPPSAGDILLNPDGTFVYTNTDPALGTDRFFYEACDGIGACVAATVSITINGEAPTVTCVLPRQVQQVGDSVNIDLSLLFRPPSGQSLIYSGTGLPLSLSIVGPLLSGILQASDLPGSPYNSALKATTVPGGATASEDLIFQVLPAGEILLRDGFDGPNPPPICM